MEDQVRASKRSFSNEPLTRMWLLRCEKVLWDCNDEDLKLLKPGANQSECPVQDDRYNAKKLAIIAFGPLLFSVETTKNRKSSRLSSRTFLWAPRQRPRRSSFFMFRNGAEAGPHQKGTWLEDRAERRQPYQQIWSSVCPLFGMFSLLQTCLTERTFF